MHVFPLAAFRGSAFQPQLDHSKGLSRDSPSQGDRSGLSLQESFYCSEHHGVCWSESGLVTSTICSRLPLARVRQVLLFYGKCSDLVLSETFLYLLHLLTQALSLWSLLDCLRHPRILSLIWRILESFSRKLCFCWGQISASPDQKKKSLSWQI